jgi:hypothetical protein
VLLAEMDRGALAHLSYKDSLDAPFSPILSRRISRVYRGIGMRCGPDPNRPPAAVVSVQPERRVVDGVMTFPCGGGIANAGQKTI